MTTRRVKVVITGYYDVKMESATKDYGTDDPAMMLKIDQNFFNLSPELVFDCLDETVGVALSWDN